MSNFKIQGSKVPPAPFRRPWIRLLYFISMHICIYSMQQDIGHFDKIIKLNIFTALIGVSTTSKTDHSSKDKPTCFLLDKLID